MNRMRMRTRMRSSTFQFSIPSPGLPLPEPIAETPRTDAVVQLDADGPATYQSGVLR
jgi:hypothetical protein